jgi:hypothetical protein
MVEVSRPRHEITILGVRHDDAMAGPERYAAGGMHRAKVNTVPERGGGRVKSSPGQEPKFILLRMKYLHAPELGAHQADRAVQDAFVQGVSIALFDERGADFLQKQRVVRTCVRSCVAVRLVFLVRHRGRQIGEPVGKLVVAGDTQPAFLHDEVIGFQGGGGGRLRFALGFGRTLVAHPNLIAQLLKHDEPELEMNAAGTRQYL